MDKGILLSGNFFNSTRKKERGRYVCAHTYQSLSPLLPHSECYMKQSRTNTMCIVRLPSPLVLSCYTVFLFSCQCTSYTVFLSRTNRREKQRLLCKLFSLFFNFFDFFFRFLSSHVRAPCLPPSVDAHTISTISPPCYLRCVFIYVVVLLVLLLCSPIVYSTRILQVFFLLVSGQLQKKLQRIRDRTGAFRFSSCFRPSSASLLHHQRIIKATAASSSFASLYNKINEAHTYKHTPLSNDGFLKYFVTCTQTLYQTCAACLARSIQFFFLI